MRHDAVTMRDWLASVPDDDLVSIIEVAPALRRAMVRDDDGGLRGLRGRIRAFTDQQVDGLAHAFLAGVAQRLRTDGFSSAEIESPDAEQLRAMLLDHLPGAHGRLALHALLIGSGPASSTARAHATPLLTALDEEPPIAATQLDHATAADTVEKLRKDAAVLAPGLRAAADAVETGALPLDAETVADALRRFTVELTGLVAGLGPVDGPAPSDLAGVEAHLDHIAERERLATERAVVLEHRAEIGATARRLEADGGPDFLLAHYTTLLADIDRELAGPRYAQATAGPAAQPPATQPPATQPLATQPLATQPVAIEPVATEPLTEADARALLSSHGIDDDLVSVLQPWPLLCDPGDHIPRGDVGEVVTAEASAVPELLQRLERLGLLDENENGEVALDELTLRCLALLPAAG